MTSVDNRINIKAKILAWIFGLLNISIYLLLTAIFFISFKTFDKLIDYLDNIALVTFGSYVISLIIACSFNIAPLQKKTVIALIYSALLILNLLTFFLYYGLSHWSEGDTWLH